MCDCFLDTVNIGIQGSVVVIDFAPLAPLLLTKTVGMSPNPQYTSPQVYSIRPDNCVCPEQTAAVQVDIPGTCLGWERALLWGEADGGTTRLVPCLLQPESQAHILGQGGMGKVCFYVFACSLHSPAVAARTSGVHP
jgi:hypothetical protein